MKIAVINSGGTISSVGNPLGPMSAKAFADACTRLLNPSIKSKFPGIDLDYITDLPFPDSSNGALDSTNLQPTDWCLMAEYIVNHYSDPDPQKTIDGWIILHGTDSMAYTGSALPFLLSITGSDGIGTAILSKPVIITGSQVPMFYKDGDQPLTLNYNTDAYQNFCGAVASARTGVPEVGVYFRNHLYRGNRVLKTNASQFDAFYSPNYPALAEAGVEYTLYNKLVLPGPVSYQVSLDNPVVLENAKKQLAYIKANINNSPVMQLNASPAWYIPETPTKKASAFIADVINAVVTTGLKGLILESYGEGNFPSGDPNDATKGAIYLALKNASQNVVIVDCTQVIAGVVNDSAYAAGAWLPDAGVLNSADMTPIAAFAKTMILVTLKDYYNWTDDQLKDLVQLNLAGEMLDVSRLDSRYHRQLLPGENIHALDGSATLTNDQKLGPILKSSDGATLWTAFIPKAEDMPGRLVMQDDGNLVFYSRYNQALWSTNTGNPKGASSQLIIAGSAKTSKNLSLKVYNYSAGVVTAPLFEQAQQ
jgi:L-asparaginase